MSERVRIAIIGIGRMGGFHARTLVGADGVEVVAVADMVPGVAAAIGHEIGAAAYTSLEALLADDAVEGWLIATPTLTHPELVSTALDSGLHVLCEKPLSLDPADGDHLGNRASSAGLILQVGFWRRFSPPWVKAKELMDGGAIGRPLMLRLAQWDANPPPASFCDPAVSGGLAIDCGVHEFDLVEWLTGLTVERVTARNLPLVDQAVGAAGDVDNLVALLDLAGGGVATVDLSRNARYGDDVRTEVLGSHGAVFVDLLPTGRTWIATGAGREMVPGSETPDAMGAGATAQAEAFAKCIRGAHLALPGAEASTRAVLIGRAVREAAASGRTVVV